MRRGSLLVAPLVAALHKRGIEPLRSEIPVPLGRQLAQPKDRLLVHAAQLLALRVSAFFLYRELLDAPGYEANATWMMTSKTRGFLMG